MNWKRIGTAVLLMPPVVAIVWWGALGLVTVTAAIVAGLALLEFFALAEHAEFQAYRLWTLASAATIFFAQWSSVQARSWVLTRDLRLVRFAPALAPPLDLVLFVFVVGLAVSVFASRRPLKAALGDIGASATGLVFIALPLSTIVRLDAVEAIGNRLLLFTLALVWAGDTMAYLVGRYMGHLQMAPELSKHKTWEGAAANLVGSLAVGAIFAGWLSVDPWQCLFMAGLANIAGQVGDLLESAYKRSAGVKDAGALLPGHGGVLDRIDALILAAPVVWYYFSLVLGSHS
jgi:phosphatidate cytidylyltransferase